MCFDDLNMTITPISSFPPFPRPLLWGVSLLPRLPGFERAMDPAQWTPQLGNRDSMNTVRLSVFGLFHFVSYPIDGQTAKPRFFLVPLYTSLHIYVQEFEHFWRSCSPPLELQKHSPATAWVGLTSSTTEAPSVFRMRMSCFGGWPQQMEVQCSLTHSYTNVRTPKLAMSTSFCWEGYVV